MLKTIRQYAFKGLSFTAAIAVFLFTLPLTLGLMLLMLFTGAVTIATLRYRISKTVKQKPVTNPKKAPIEGSYTVIDK